MGTISKLDEGADLHWDDCKIIEEIENGELKVNEDNLNRFLQRMQKAKLDTGGPIVFVAFRGSPKRGNAFCTNLLATCLESNGYSWANKIKTLGLKGFAYGSTVSSSMHIPDIPENNDLKAGTRAKTKNSASSERNSEQGKSDHTGTCINEDTGKINGTKRKKSKERENGVDGRGIKYETVANILQQVEAEIEHMKPGRRREIHEKLVKVCREVQSVVGTSSDDDQTLEVKGNITDEHGNATDLAITKKTDTSAVQKDETCSEENDECSLNEQKKIRMKFHKDKICNGREECELDTDEEKSSTEHVKSEIETEDEESEVETGDEKSELEMKDEKSEAEKKKNNSEVGTKDKKSEAQAEDEEYETAMEDVQTTTTSNKGKSQGIRYLVKNIVKLQTKSTKKSKIQSSPEDLPHKRRSRRLAGKSASPENKQDEPMEGSRESKKNENKKHLTRKNGKASCEGVQGEGRSTEVLNGKESCRRGGPGKSKEKPPPSTSSSRPNTKIEEQEGIDIVSTSSEFLKNGTKVASLKHQTDTRLSGEKKEGNPNKADKHSNSHKNMFYPDQSTSGIYCWPKFFNLEHSDRKLLWIMYAHHASSESIPQKGANLIDRFLEQICSVLVEIQWEETITDSSLQQPGPSSKSAAKSNQCQRVIRIVKEESENTPSQDETCLNFFIDLEDGSKSSENSTVNLNTKQCRTIKALVEAITEENNLKILKFGERIPKPLSSLNLRDFLQFNVARLSSNKCIPSPDKFSLPQTPNSKTRPALLAKPTPKKAHGKPKSPHGSSNEGSRSRSTTPVNVATVIETEKPTNQRVVKTLPTLSPPPDKKRFKAISPASSPPEQRGLRALPPASPPPPEEQDNIFNDPPMEEILRLQFTKFKSKLTSWMESTEISLETVQDISKIYDKYLRKFYEEQLEFLQTKKNSPEDAARTVQMYVEEVNKELGSTINDIQMGLTSIIQNVEKHLKLPSRKHVNYQTEHSLDQMVKDTLKQCGKESVEFIQLGAKKVIDKCKAEMETLKEASLKGNQIIRDCHQAYFHQLLSSNKPCDPIILYKCHEQLTNDMLLAYMEIFCSVDDQNELRQNLSDDFFNFHTKTLSKLEIQMKAINRLIEKFGKYYEQQMDILLRDNPTGLEDKKFESENNRLLEQCVKNLIDAIHQEISKDEPTDCHILAFKKDIEKTYTMLQEENKAAMESRDDSRNKLEKAKNESLQKDQNGLVPFVDNHYGGQRQTDVKTDLLCNKLGNKPRIMLLQIACHQITAASIQKGREQKEPEDMTIYPAVVTLTHNNEWLFGLEACKQSGKRTWHVQEYWPQGNWVEEILVDRQRLSINVDFLLAILITGIKRKFTDATTEKETEALVAVPYWFTSFHRQQVLNAAGISGLVNVQLINENSCSAFTFHEPNYDTVVISENSLKVDISLYSYDYTRGMLTLRGHCGDYEAKDASKENESMLKYIAHGILYYFVGHYQEAGVEDEALQNLEQLWHLTLSRAEAQGYVPKKRQRKVILCCESDQWRDLLWKLARKICDPKFIHVRADTPLYGLASIYHSPKFKKCSTIRYDITDSSPFQTLCCTPQNVYIQETHKHSNGPSQSKVQKFEIYKTFAFLRIHQINSGMNTQVATLSIKKFPPYFKSITIALERSLNGILEVQSVEYTKRDSMLRSYTDTIPPNFYTWESFSLCEKQLTALKFAVSQIKWQKTLNPVVKDLEDAIMLGEKIKEAIGEGKGKFVSTNGKEDILEVIDSSLEKLRHQNNPEYFVQQQKQLFNDMSVRYKIKL